ncbi:MAG: redoxin domain-containing protein [Caulobacterales bacterium]
MRFARVWAGAAVAIAALALGFVGLKAPGAGAAHADATGVMPAKVDNFRLTDENLQSHELYRNADAAAVVIFTQGDGCPVVRNTMAALGELQQTYGAKGVEFMMLNSDPQDSREDIAAEAKDYGFQAPVLRDTNQLVGEQLGVTRTAEAIIINPKTWKIVYRGPIDDRVTYERQKAKADHTWAKDALDAMLAGQAPAISQEPAVGCLIDFPHRAEAMKATPVSYSKVIAPIIETKCAMCHQQGGIGPMPLTSYDKVKAFSPMIREVLRTERMPPYHADITAGEKLADANRQLTPDETKAMVHWVEQGAPRGDGPDPLAAARFQVAEWPLGKPDLVLDIPCYNIPASGIVDYQRPYVVNPLTEGKWMRASTIKVGDRQGVHHILTGYMTTAPKPGEQAFEDRWKASVGGYAVGAESTVEPNNIGVYIPPGGAIGFQNHYTPYGKAATDCSKIALYFYDQKPGLVMRNSVIANPMISIPPNTERHPEVSYLVFPKDAILYSAFPHAHYRGASAQLILRTPDGKEKLLLALPHYDFNWQRDYAFAEPIKVPAGSWLIAKWTYDNSKRNPANPDPNRTVPWGDQSFDEMLYTAIRYRWADETSDHLTEEYQTLLEKSMMMGFLDSNLDGKVELSELRGQFGDKVRPYFSVLDADHDGSLDANELATLQKYMGGGRRQASAK